MILTNNALADFKLIMNSKDLLEKAKQAYYNVQHKEYTKRSFIAGYLIGRAEQLCQSNVVRQSEQLVCDNQELDCPYDFTSRCTLGRCYCKPKVN